MRQLYYEHDVMVHLFPYPTSALSMRVSAQVYNTRADFNRAADALLAFVEKLERQKTVSNEGSSDLLVKWRGTGHFTSYLESY